MKPPAPNPAATQATIPVVLETIAPVAPVANIIGAPKIIPTTTAPTNTIASVHFPIFFNVPIGPPSSVKSIY